MLVKKKDTELHALVSTALKETLSECVIGRMMFFLGAITASHFTAPPFFSSPFESTGRRLFQS